MLKKAVIIGAVLGIVYLIFRLKPVNSFAGGSLPSPENPLDTTAGKVSFGAGIAAVGAKIAATLAGIGGGIAAAVGIPTSAAIAASAAGPAAIAVAGIPVTGELVAPAAFGVAAPSSGAGATGASVAAGASLIPTLALTAGLGALAAYTLKVLLTPHSKWAIKFVSDSLRTRVQQLDTFFNQYVSIARKYKTFSKDAMRRMRNRLTDFIASVNGKAYNWLDSSFRGTIISAAQNSYNLAAAEIIRLHPELAGWEK